MPYGVVQTDTVKDSLNNVFAPASAVMRNRIINGAMVIDQRNSGASVTPTSGQYLVDRWLVYVSQTSKFTAQQNAGSVTPPLGFTYYLGITSSSAYSITASDYFMLLQKIEGYNIADLGWGTANAKAVTLSFQVYSSLTGTFGGSIRNSAATASYPFTYSIPVANTWTTISINIPGATIGTWLSTNGSGLEVDFGLGVGSTYSGTAGTWAAADYRSATGAVSVVGTNNAKFYITGVQLEVGLNATNFEYRQYGTELALCQRYYFKPNPATAYVGGQNNTNSGLVAVIFPVTMRATPTGSYSGTFTVDNFVASGTTTAASLNSATTDYARTYFQTVSGYTGTAGQAFNINAANVGVHSYSAEL